MCRCCKRLQKKKKCNVAEPTVMAELSKCCSDSNVANIAVPSSIAKCSRVYTKSRKFANVTEPTDMTDLSNIAVLSMVAIIAQTLRILQMLQRL